MEKERLEKVKKAIDIGIKLSWIYEQMDFNVKGSPKHDDLFFVSRLLVEDWKSLWFDLYPTDLMEDVKKRMEAYKLRKSGIGNRIPPLSLKQKFELLFKREGNENAK